MRPRSGWEVLTTCRTCCHAVQMREVVLQAAAGLHALGLRKGDHVSLFSENSAKWLVAEQGCAKNGVTTAVRGATAPVDELQYIYNHSDSKAVVLQVRQRRLLHHHPSARCPSARLPVAEYGGLCPVLCWGGQDAALLRKLSSAGWLQSDFGPPKLVVLLKSDVQVCTDESRS